MAGQARAVAAGALDPDQGDGPEPAQPAQQAGVAGRGDRELPHAEQSPDGVQRGGDVRVGVSVHAAGDGARIFYDGHAIPVSLVERGGTHPLAVGPWEPRPLAKDGKIRPARRWVPQRSWARPTNRSKDSPNGRQPIRGSSRTQAPDPTPEPPQNHAGRAGPEALIHILPADYERFG
jgi:hypothetical protein